MAPQTESCRMPFRNWDEQLVELGSPKKSLLTIRVNLCPLSSVQVLQYKVSQVSAGKQDTLWRLDFVGSTRNTPTQASMRVWPSPALAECHGTHDAEQVDTSVACQQALCISPPY